MARRQTRRRKERKNVVYGVAHIQSTFNNTLILITDKREMLFPGPVPGQWDLRFKSTPFAAQMAAETCAKEAMEHGMKQVECLVKGPGAGRKRQYVPYSSRLEVSMIKDVTPIPHNGADHPKKKFRRYLCRWQDIQVQFAGCVGGRCQIISER